MSNLKIVLSLLGLALDVSGRRHASNRNSMSLSKESTTTASTTTFWFLSAEHENDLPDCLSIPTFPGKCQISQSPGACYSKEEDEVWQCWSDLQPQETMTDSTCKETVLKDGACVFKEHFVKHSDDDLKSCWDVPGFNSQCNPVTEMWGACYHKDLDEWRCIPKDSPIEVLKGYLDGDCKATPTAADNAVAYDDVCSFQDADQAVYKCPGVPTYNENVPYSSCLQENIAFACFSLREGVTWQCIESDESVPSCISTQIPDAEQVEKGEAYDGVCVHDTSDLYDSAKSADDLTIRTTPTTTTKATTTTTTIAKTVTTETPIEITTTLGSGALKSQLSGVLFVVFFFCSQALLM